MNIPRLIVEACPAQLADLQAELIANETRHADLLARIAYHEHILRISAPLAPNPGTLDTDNL